MRFRQLSFLPKPRREYGGLSSNEKRKVQRPFDPKRALHLSLKAKRGTRSLIPLKWTVHGHLARIAGRRRVKVYRYANVGNHLHLLIQARSRPEFQAFLREFAGAVAVSATGAAKGRPAKFWEASAWSQIVEWGRQFTNTARYILLNVLEGSGLRDRALLARLERDGIIWVIPRAGPGPGLPSGVAH